jgi:hypothetical protein
MSLVHNGICVVRLLGNGVDCPLQDVAIASGHDVMLGRCYDPVRARVRGRRGSRVRETAYGRVSQAVRQAETFDDERTLLNVRMALYIAIAVILIVFGYFALFSIGWPFAVTGILMLALIGQRHRFDVLAPALAWPWVFTIGYLVVAPIGCTATPTIAGGADEGWTRCDSLFLTYAGPTPYRPPFLPAVLTGVALATAGSLAIQWTLRRRRGDRRSLDPGVAASSN